MKFICTLFFLSYSFIAHGQLHTTFIGKTESQCKMGISLLYPESDYDVVSKTNETKELGFTDEYGWYHQLFFQSVNVDGKKELYCISHAIGIFTTDEEYKRKIKKIYIDDYFDQSGEYTSDFSPKYISKNKNPVYLATITYNNQKNMVIIGYTLK